MSGAKRFRVINGVGVYDELTDRTYSTHRKLCELLNKENDRANRNVEQYDDVARILTKYGIRDLEKLDQILFQQKVW